MVLVQFVADTLFKTLVAVPIVGGLVLVALVVGGNPFDLLRLDDLTQTVSTMVGVLLAQPVALAAFVVSMGVILAGGSILMFAIKAGSVTVLLAGDRSAGTIEVPPLTDVGVARGQPGHARAIHDRRADAVFALPAARHRVDGGYALIGAAYIAFLFGSTNSALDNPIAVTLASLSVLVAITLVNFIYLLLQIVIAAEDCAVLEAVPHVARLLRRRTQALALVLAAILALMLMATAASILATTALGLIAFVPFVGLAALPLQVFAWLVRGVVFQYVGLTGVATYLRLHFALQSATVAVRTPSDGLATVTRGDDLSLSNAASNFQESPIRRIGGLSATIPGLISLSAGYPAPDMFPWKDIESITAQILARHDGNTLQYGATRGYRPLIEHLIANTLHGARHRGAL